LTRIAAPPTVAQTKTRSVQGCAPHLYCPLLVVVRARAASAQDDKRWRLLCGKTFTVNGRGSVGGIFDLYARILARHIGQQFRQPNVIVQNAGAAAGVSRTAFQLTGPHTAPAIGITSTGDRHRPVMTGGRAIRLAQIPLGRHPARL